MFFIISGFVILMSASSNSARRFVVSRLVRLYPAFWVCCTATFIAIIIVGSTRDSTSLRQYAINMTMLSGFTGVEPIDGSYWSLFVEIKFYALVFVVLLIGQIHRAKELLGLWLVIVLIVSKWPIPHINFFLIPQYASYFIAGAMFYLISAEGFSTYKLLVLFASYLAAIRNAIDYACIQEAWYHWHFDSTVIAIILAMYFLVLLLVSTGRTKPVASDKWLLCGALTYPLYLIHQEIGYLIFNLTSTYLNPYFLMVGTLTIMLLVAYTVNRKVEKAYSRPMKVMMERLLAIRR